MEEKIDKQPKKLLTFQIVEVKKFVNGHKIEEYSKNLLIVEKYAS